MSKPTNAQATAQDEQVPAQDDAQATTQDDAQDEQVPAVDMTAIIPAIVAELMPAAQEQGKSISRVAADMRELERQALSARHRREIEELKAHRANEAAAGIKNPAKLERAAADRRKVEREELSAKHRREIDEIKAYNTDLAISGRAARVESKAAAGNPAKAAAAAAQHTIAAQTAAEQEDAINARLREIRG